MESKKKRITNELICRIEMDSQTSKTNLELPKGQRGRGRDGLGVWDCGIWNDWLVGT